MERDYMKHPNDGNVNGSGMPDIGGHVLSEMRRASIEIQEYVDNYHKEINAHHITLNESHNELLNHYSDFVDIPVSTENYWTVRMVGVYAINNHQGETSFVGLMHDNTIYVAGASISNGIVDWNQNNVNQPMNFFYVYQVVTLHELGHAFGLRHIFQPGELMYPSLMYNNLGASFTVNDLQFIQSRAILVNNSLSCEL